MTTSNSYIYYAQLSVGTPRQRDIHVILDTVRIPSLMHVSIQEGLYMRCLRTRSDACILDHQFLSPLLSLAFFVCHQCRSSTLNPLSNLQGSSVFAIFAVPHGGPSWLVIFLLVAACILGATSVGLLILSWYQGQYEDMEEYDPLMGAEEGADLPSKA
jgi:hypothetical protein